MAIKTIYFLRHGQYTRNPSEKLTSLGRNQARRAGKRLGSIGPFHQVHCSTMPRAIETAKIVLSEMGSAKKLIMSDLLREAVPGFPKELRGKYSKTAFTENKRQVDRAFKRLFTFSKRSRRELVVCHGNVIRYLVCKAMGVNPSLWAQLDVLQCGLSIVELDGVKRTIKVVAHNDAGHIPAHLQTYI